MMAHTHPEPTYGKCCEETFTERDNSYVTGGDLLLSQCKQLFQHRCANKPCGSSSWMNALMLANYFWPIIHTEWNQIRDIISRCKFFVVFFSPSSSSFVPRVFLCFSPLLCPLSKPLNLFFLPPLRRVSFLHFYFFLCLLLLCHLPRSLS